MAVIYYIAMISHQGLIRIFPRVSGIGTQLMARCNDWAKSQGAEQIRLEVMAFNKSAQSFYVKLGFEEQSKTMWKTVN
nr:GNAT family N-acetyltransferase [Vibrio cholerae]